MAVLAGGGTVHAAAFNVGALPRHSLEDLCVGVSSRGHFGGSALWRGSISEQASYAERCFAWFFSGWDGI